MSDPRPPGRIRDPDLLRRLHLEWRECALCMSVGYGLNFEFVGLSLHHICKHPRDDVRGNLVMVCGDGVRGCHGRLEARDPVVCHLLGDHVLLARPDVLEHLRWRMGEEAASEWIRRNLWLDS